MPAAGRGACVTGMGVVSPIGMETETFWDALLAGRGAAGPVRAFDSSAMPRRLACEVPPFEALARLLPFASPGRCTELALMAADQALRGAGLEPGDSHPGLKVVVGTTMGEVTAFERQCASGGSPGRGREAIASLAAGPLDVMGRSLVAWLGCDRPALSVPAACAAGAYAVGLAADLVRRGEAARALAVGCEALSRLAFVGFARLGAMSPDVCRPFSATRRGLLVGEGAAALLMEPEAGARARGADVIGRVESIGLSCDAFHPTGPHPEASGAVRAMQDALRRAGIPAGRIDYVNAHGTGTLMNDRTEALAVRRVFGADGAPPVSSIKALTGHMMGAAGAVEAVATLLALRHGVVPPTWNWEAPDPDCPIDCVPNEPRRSPLRWALSNSYAFGGNNASLVLSGADRTAD